MKRRQFTPEKIIRVEKCSCRVLRKASDVLIQRMRSTDRCFLRQYLMVLQVTGATNSREIS
jgi:hypothetical protein